MMDRHCDSAEVGPAQRKQLLEQIAARIPRAIDGSCVRVGVDGPDGSGKTMFADELAATVDRLGRPAIRVSADDFHNVRAVRYRLGRESPVGFWLDSYDYEHLIADVLDPLGPSGGNRYRPAAHDLKTDAVLDPPWRTATPGAVVIIDGLFLHRQELVDCWDFSIFLDVPFGVTAARMAAREGSNPDPQHPSMHRYIDAQRIYFSECSPQSKATVVVDNADLDSPRLILPISDHVLADPGDVTIESYDGGIDQYLETSSPPSEPVRRYLDRYAALVAGGRVLELGSGPGWDADYLESRGLCVERSDATPSFVARLWARGHNARVLDARDSNYGGPYDGVFADAVLLHLSRPQFEQALLTAHRATRPRGVLGITLKEGDGSAWSIAKLGRPRCFTYWRAEDLSNLLARTGWAPEAVGHFDGRKEPWLFALARSR